MSPTTLSCDLLVSLAYIIVVHFTRPVIEKYLDSLPQTASLSEKTRNRTIIRIQTAPPKVHYLWAACWSMTSSDSYVQQHFEACISPVKTAMSVETHHRSWMGQNTDIVISVLAAFTYLYELTQTVHDPKLTDYIHHLGWTALTVAFYWKLEAGGMSLVLSRTVAWVTFWSLGSASVALLANFLMYIYQPTPNSVMRHLYICNTIFMIVTRLIEWSLYSYYTVNGTWAEAVTISDKLFCLGCYVLGASFCWIQWTWVSQHAQRSRILLLEDLKIWKRAHEGNVLVEETHSSALLKSCLRAVQVTFVTLLCRKLLVLH